MPKRCPQGYHLSRPRCVKDQPADRTPSRSLRTEEARRIIEILKELKPKVSSSTPDDVKEQYAAREMKDGFLHQDDMKVLYDLDTEMLIEANLRTPVFFLYAFPRMSDPRYRESHPDPGDRYDFLRKKFMEATNVKTLAPVYKYTILKSYLITFGPKATRPSLRESGL